MNLQGVFRAAAWGVAALMSSGCTLHHSKQALSASSVAPRADSTFVTEEDSGLMLAGLVMLAEPDHYAVLLERARKRFGCAAMHHAQFDFYTEHWLIVAFPISRITLICEPDAPTPQPSSGLRRGRSVAVRTAGGAVTAVGRDEHTSNTP